MTNFSTKKKCFMSNKKGALKRVGCDLIKILRLL